MLLITYELCIPCTHTRTRTHARTHTHTQTCLHTNTCKRKHITRKHIYTSTHMRSYTHTNGNVHTCTHANTPKYTHPHTHTDTHKKSTRVTCCFENYSCARRPEGPPMSRVIWSPLKSRRGQRRINRVSVCRCTLHLLKGTHARARTHAYKRTHTHTHACTHTRMHAHTHTLLMESVFHLKCICDVLPPSHSSLPLFLLPLFIFLPSFEVFHL